MERNLFCKKCGRTLWTLNDNQKNCDCCDSIMFDIPNKYIDNFRWRDGDGKQALIEELIKTSPEFDQYLFDHRDEILAKQSVEFNAKMEHGREVLEEASRKVTCSYCGSSNVKKITIVNKAVHTSIFGIWSIGRNAKNYHCNNCGSDF